MTYTDIVVMWNHGRSFEGQGSPRQEDLLRKTLSGNLFAYAHRNDAQRRHAFQRVITAYPQNNSKKTWLAYFKDIANERIPFPAGVSAFRPTLDWALTPQRFGVCLELRKARAHQKWLLKNGTQVAVNDEDVELH